MIIKKIKPPDYLVGYNKNIQIYDHQGKSKKGLMKKIEIFKRKKRNIFLITPNSMNFMNQFENIELYDLIFPHFSTESFPNKFDDLFLKILKIKV
jgi:hypothetical protein